MTAHTWVVEIVDGGPLGSDDYWICPVCGASAGHVGVRKMEDGGYARSKKPRMSPFLAGMGHALKLSEDCDETSKIIRAFTSDCIERLPTERRDVSPAYADLLRDALEGTDTKNVTAIFHAYQDIAMRRFSAPRPLDELRADLAALGFQMTAAPPDARARRLAARAERREK